MTMNGVMIPSVSAGSNHFGASETCTPHVIWPSGPAATGAATASRASRTKVTTTRRWRKVCLLIATGFAFIRQRRRGRLLANVYVVASLIESIVAGVAVSVHFGSIVAVLYLVLVFLLVNKVFAEDLKY